MNASLAIGIRCLLGVVLLLSFAARSASHGEETRRKPRAAPWEIEPTEETKRRIEEGYFLTAGPPQLIISARLGERRAIKFKRPPLSIQVPEPGKAVVIWTGEVHAELHGLTAGFTSMDVTYPAIIAGEEDETIHYLIRVHAD